MKSCNTHLSWDVAALTVASCAARIHYMLEQPGLSQSCHCRGGNQPLWHAAGGARGGDAPDPREQGGHCGAAHVGPGAPSPGGLCGSTLPDAPLRCSPEAQPGAQSLAVIPRSLFPVSCLLTICSTQMPFEYLQRSLGQDSHT